jgi:hypothetical protein
MSENDNLKTSRGVRRIPQQSLLYDRIVPLALLGMAVLLLVIIVIALGFLLGLFHL